MNRGLFHAHIPSLPSLAFLRSFAPEVFESKEGKGSTFGFRLPIKRLSTPPPPQKIEE
jgi:hypothetical protein